MPKTTVPSASGEVLREALADSHGGIEWEDGMAEINRMTTPANMRWKLVDRETDAANHKINWAFQGRFGWRTVISPNTTRAA